jgi:hypothetical protein
MEHNCVKLDTNGRALALNTIYSSLNIYATCYINKSIRRSYLIYFVSFHSTSLLNVRTSTYKHANTFDNGDKDDNDNNNNKNTCMYTHNLPEGIVDTHTCKGVANFAC